VKIWHKVLSVVCGLLVLPALLWAGEAVRIDTGAVRGTLENGVRVYRGIPYAAPPVGDLRWRAPQPVKPWNTVLQCDKFCPSCPQPKYDPVGRTSEDCLYLNIWTQARERTEKLPVMVWIHGGAWTFGSGSLPRYNGSNLAQKGVVVVTLNYRLGPFGFLAHPLLNRESPMETSGNYGFLDQIAALQWVQRNIAAFGGDPAKVTIFGESAGSISVNLHLVSPLSRGLFCRAVAESGGVYPFRALFPQNSGNPEQAFKMGERFAEVLKCDKTKDPIAAMRAKTTDEIMGAFAFSWGPGATGLAFVPVFDGKVLPGNPLEIIARGEQLGVPLIMGSNRDDGSAFYPGMTPKQYQSWLQSLYPNAWSRVFSAFRADKPQEVKPAFASFLTISMFSEPARFTVASMAQKGVPAYLYQFARLPQTEGARKFGVYHGLEVDYVFGGLDKKPGYTQDDLALSQAVMNYWTNFAKNGNPNRPGLELWPAYQSERDENLELDSPLKVNSRLWKTQSDLVESLHYTGK